MTALLAALSVPLAAAAIAALAATRGRAACHQRPPTVPQSLATAIRRHDPTVSWLNGMPGGCRGDCTCNRRDGRIDGYGKRRRGTP